MNPLAFLPFAAMAVTLQLTAAERTAAFHAAGFSQVGGRWQACGDPGTESYTPGAIEQIADLNGDGRPEALITEGSSYCFGATEVAYALVSKQVDGSWKLMAQGPGIATFLATRGTGGWSDLEIGGPGFCFPIERWNGRAYTFHRNEYEGKPCRP